MIDIELFEEDIKKILKGDSEAVSAHPEITRSDEKKAALDALAVLATVDSYQGNIEEILAEDIIALPAALLVYGGATPSGAEAREGAKGNVKVSLNIILVGQNLAGRGEASSDVRRILKNVRTVINGMIYRDGNMERTLLWSGEVLSLMNNQGVCAYEQMYTYKDYFRT